MTSNADFYEEVANAIERMQKRIDELEGKDNIREAKNVLTDLKRERNLARSERETSANEMSVLAEKLNNGRNEIEEQIKAAKSRHETVMEAMRKQSMHIYDSAAQTQSALDQIKSEREQFDQSKESLMNSHDWIMNNMTTRREELERFGAKEFIEQQINQREQEGLTRLQQEHLDRNLRLLVSDPSAFAQQIQQTFAPPEQPDAEG